jgi:hypothetical protein
MLQGVTQANALNALAAGAGIVAANIAGNIIGARIANVNAVDAVVLVAGLVVIGMGGGAVRAAGIGMAGMGAARLIQRNVLAGV